MPRTQAWSQEQINAALELADAIGLREAAKATGVPFGTLARHNAKRQTRQTGRTKQGETAPPGSETPFRKAGRPPAAGVANETRQAIIERAVAQVGDEVADAIRGMTADLRRVAGKALAQVEGALDEAEGKRKKPDAQWVRTLVGIVAQTVEKSQLLAGRPTTRQAVEGAVTHQADLSQVLADPEALELARLLFRRQSQGEAGAPAAIEEGDGAAEEPPSLPN